MFTRAYKTLVSLAFLLTLTSCHVASIGIHVPLGPPHHAPAHGYYDYHYYPDVGIYFDVSRNLYFYLDGGHWVSTARLPTYIHLRGYRYVPLRTRSARPYAHYHNHRRAHPGKWGHKRHNHARKHYKNHRHRHEHAREERHRDRKEHKKKRRKRWEED